jgi:2'-5' RNA ligase
VPRVYTLQVILPEDVQEQLREWTARTPGATLPEGGAHITLLSAFSPVRPRAPIRKRTAAVCATFRPFPIRLNRVLSGSHFRRPSLYGVFLMGNGLTEGIRELIRLHRELRDILEPYKRDLHPEVSKRRFKPHVSLTWGIPPGQAVGVNSDAS